MKTGNNLINANGGKDEIKLGVGSDTVNMLAQPATVSLNAKLTSWFTSNANSPVNFEFWVNDKKVVDGSVVSNAAKLLSNPNGYWADEVQVSFSLPANTALSKVQVVSKSSGILQVNQLSVDNVTLPPSASNAVKDGTGNVKLNWVSSSAPIAFEVLPYIQNSLLQTTVDGDIGIDKVVYPAKSSDYAISYSPAGTLTVQGKIATSQLDVLSNVERVAFTDKSIAYDLNGNAGIAAKILGAVFGPQSLTNQNYVGIGLSFLDAGWSYDNLAALALDAAGAKTNDQIVSLLWKNVIGSQASAAEKAPYISMLSNGMAPGALAHLAAETSFNITSINLVGLAISGLEYLTIS